MGSICIKICSPSFIGKKSGVVFTSANSAITHIFHWFFSQRIGKNSPAPFYNEISLRLRRITCDSSMKNGTARGRELLYFRSFFDERYRREGWGCEKGERSVDQGSGAGDAEQAHPDKKCAPTFNNHHFFYWCFIKVGFHPKMKGNANVHHTSVYFA